MNAETERLVFAAAERAAAAVAARVPSKEEIELIAARSSERAVSALLERLRIDPEKMDEWDADRLWLRNRRELESAVIRQGIMAVVLAILGALGTAVIFWIRSGAPR